MYDEAIEVYDEDDEEFDYENRNNSMAELSPVRKPKPPISSGFNRGAPVPPSRAENLDYRDRDSYSNNNNSQAGFNRMEPLEEIRTKTLSSKDFVTPRPGTSQRQQGSSSISSPNPPPPSTNIGNILADKGFSSGAIGHVRKMSDLQKVSSLDEKESAKKPSSTTIKGRPMSAQRRGPPSDDDDDDDDEDDEFDEELNVAQIEGLIGKRYIDRRGDYADGLSDSESTSTDSDTIDPEFEDPLDRAGRDQPSQRQGRPAMTPAQRQPIYQNFDVFKPLEPPEPPFDQNGMGMIFDTCFDIPPPQNAYHVPPLLDDEAMDEYIRHRKLWEIQMDMKRAAIGEEVRASSMYPGIHDWDYPIYNPEDYANLTVSPEIKEIFGYITQYVPPGLNSQQDVKLHPFIPDYYPSVGDIDAFIKVVDPEVKDDSLGIKCLDEPAPFQSDPSVLDLRLRALAKQNSAKAVVIKKVENVGKNSKIIENWIKDISDLHRSKPSPSVHYSKISASSCKEEGVRRPMPDIDFLMQEWPPEMEELLKSANLPSPDLNCDLATYVDIVCNMLDIPIYKSRIQSLHVLFTLFTSQKQFSQFGGGANMLGLQGNDQGDLMPSTTSNRLSDDVDHLQLS